jgi:glycerol-3-phosphate O-acyltransferase
VQAAVDAYCDEQEVGRSVAMRTVDRYAREIVPSFNAYLYFRIGYAIARAVAKSMYRVRLGFADDPDYARIDRKSTVVFVMNHRSNMDYILVAFLAAERAALSYAVGEWAKIWPLQQLVRSMGAYFVRRNSGDPLYRAVLQRYVQMATEAGVCQAMFPEGGLTQGRAVEAPEIRPARLHGQDLQSPR